MILIIDDDDDLRGLLRKRLESNGYEILDSGDGEHGILLALENQPDLIILDVIMPSMNGHQVWSLIKRNEKIKNIPILILSGKMQATDKYWGHLIHKEDYMTKPYDPSHLLERVRDKLSMSHCWA